MSGLLRNFVALLRALFSWGDSTPQSCVVSHFRVTPLDAGVRVIKSDKVLQLAECAQLDFMVRTRLIVRLLREGIGFINASQLIVFARPIGMFARVRMKTSVLCADDKFAWFAHTLWVGEAVHAEVLVKMKFKQGRRTVCPSDVLGECPAEKPARVLAWDQALSVS
jgi:acyl-CoA thioesterase FadM